MVKEPGINQEVVSVNSMGGSGCPVGLARSMLRVRVNLHACARVHHRLATLTPRHETRSPLGVLPLRAPMRPIGLAWSSD